MLGLENMYTEFFWVGKHVPGKYQYETDELTQPKANPTQEKSRLKVAFGAIFLP